MDVPATGAMPDINQHSRPRGIPSQQSPNHRFSSMVQQLGVYMLNGVGPWMDHIDPGPTRRVKYGTLTPIQ